MLYVGDRDLRVIDIWVIVKAFTWSSTMDFMGKEEGLWNSLKYIHIFFFCIFVSRIIITPAPKERVHSFIRFLKEFMTLKKSRITSVEYKKKGKNQNTRRYWLKGNRRRKTSNRD